MMRSRSGTKSIIRPALAETRSRMRVFQRASSSSGNAEQAPTELRQGLRERRIGLHCGEAGRTCPRRTCRLADDGLTCIVDERALSDTGLAADQQQDFAPPTAASSASRSSARSCARPYSLSGMANFSGRSSLRARKR